VGDGFVPKPGHLVVLINQYGEEIEYDLFERGCDILDWFRGKRPWSQLTRLISRLPNHSHYKAAVLNNDEMAKAAIESGMASEPRTMVGWTPEVAAITDNTAWVKNLYGLLAAVNSDGKFPDLPKSDIPETAFDRQRKSSFIERHRQRARLLLAQ
jgi:hypothetical protein